MPVFSLFTQSTSRILHLVQWGESVVLYRLAQQSFLDNSNLASSVELLL